MSPPLNPNAESFQPLSYSLIPFSQHPTVFPLSSFLLPSSDFHPTVLPPYAYPPPPPPPPPLLLQVPAPCSFYNQYPPKGEEICYWFPSLPPPPTKLISDYTHHGSLKIMAKLDLYEGNRIGTGCFMKISTGRSRRCSKKLQLPPPPSKKLHWQPKSGPAVVNGGGGGGAAAALASSGQIQKFGSNTTVMIKNIPNRYCREMLLKLLVNHCKEENEKEEINSEVTKSAFDFVYLPIDFETKCNKGYAFVNFTNPNGVWRLFKSLNCRKWDEFKSKKICEVTYAKIQGKAALVKHFNGSTFVCEKDEFLPVYFNPFYDGSVQDESVEVVTVGKRTARLLPSTSA